MSARNTLDSRSGNTPPVDKMLGTAYDTVRSLAQKLPLIEYLGANLDGIATDIETAEDGALAAEQGAIAKAAEALVSQLAAAASQQAAHASELASAASAVGLADAVVSAAGSATVATTQAAAAVVSAGNAHNSEVASAASQGGAGASAAAARTSEVNSGNSATASSASAGASATSQAAALLSENHSKTSETNASASAAAALVSQNASKTSETNSKTSETNSGTKEAAAVVSAAAALVSQNAAKTSETNSKTSETNSAGSAATAVTSNTQSTASAAASEVSRQASGVSATASAASAAAALVSKTNAGTSETNAATSAAAALVSQNAAKTSETNSKTSETNSATSLAATNVSKTAAAASASSASTSATAAAASAAAAAAGGGASDAQVVSYTHGATGTVARTLAAKERELPSLMDFGATGSNETKDTDALTKALTWAIANNNFFTVPVGTFLIAQAMPSITNAAAMIGVSPMRSIFKLSPDFQGTFLTVLNAGFGDEDVDYPIGGNTAWINGPADLIAGAALRGFSIIGDRTLGKEQNGLDLIGNVDHLSVHDLFLGYLNGHSIAAGMGFNGVRGCLRESEFSKLRIRACGNADTASVSFYNDASPANPGSDSSNLFTLDDIQIVFPYGRGLEFVDLNPTPPVAPLYGVTGRRIMLHGRYASATRNVGALLHIEGNITDVELDVNFAFNEPGDVCFRSVASDGGASPSNIIINAKTGSCGAGAELLNGSNLQWNVKHDSYTIREMLTIGGNLEGPVSVECKNDSAFLQVPVDFTLNGVTAVAMTSLRTNQGIGTFFSAVAAGGTNDTMKISIDGMTGTIKRTGSLDAGTDAYTFQPDSNFGALKVRAGTWMSKFVVDSGSYWKFSGRFRYAPLDRWGIEAQSIKVMADGALKFAVAPASGDTNHKLIAQSDGNLIMASYDKAGVQKNVWSIFAHFDGGPLTMNMAMPLNVGGVYNAGSLLQMGTYSVWAPAGKLRIVAGIPTSDTVGTVVGAQT